MEIQFDKNDVPFLPFPHPYTSLVLTPQRPTDGDAVMEILNDPRVYLYLVGPPFPYTSEDWDSWVPIQGKTIEESLAELKEVHNAREKGDETGRKWVSTFPLNAIREIDEKTGEQKFLGELVIRRKGFRTITDETERKAMKVANDSLEDGDPKTEWEIGFYLSPSTHGRGIMSAVLRVAIDSFFKPYMNVHHITGAFLDNNPASRRVFEKNGFVFDRIYPDMIELSEKKTGVKGNKVGLGITRWNREETQAQS